MDSMGPCPDNVDNGWDALLAFADLEYHNRVVRYQLSGILEVGNYVEYCKADNLVVLFVFPYSFYDWDKMVLVLL